MSSDRILSSLFFRGLQLACYGLHMGSTITLSHQYPGKKKSSFQKKIALHTGLGVSSEASAFSAGAVGVCDISVPVPCAWPSFQNQGLEKWRGCALKSHHKLLLGCGSWIYSLGSVPVSCIFYRSWVTFVLMLVEVENMVTVLCVMTWCLPEDSWHITLSCPLQECQTLPIVLHWFCLSAFRLFLQSVQIIRHPNPIFLLVCWQGPVL